MVHYSLQILKSNLQSKAYIGNDVSESGGLTAIVKAMVYHSFKEIFTAGKKLMIQEHKCQYTDLGKSFIRITDPKLKKTGGGLRVKKIVIRNNWKQITNTAHTGILTSFDNVLVNKIPELITKRWRMAGE